MPVLERPARLVTCADCGKTEPRSPYGPAPTRCVGCDQARDRARKRPSATTVSQGIHPGPRTSRARV